MMTMFREVPLRDWSLPPSTDVALTAYERNLLRSLSLAREVVVLSTLADGPNTSAIMEETINAAMDRLMADLMENYSGAVCPEDFNAVIDNLDRSTDFEFLRQFSQGIIPFAIARVLIKRFRVKFDVRIPHWVSFSERYKELIG